MSLDRKLYESLPRYLENRLLALRPRCLTVKEGVGDGLRALVVDGRYLSVSSTSASVLMSAASFMLPRIRLSTSSKYQGLVSTTSSTIFPLSNMISNSNSTG